MCAGTCASQSDRVVLRDSSDFWLENPNESWIKNCVKIYNSQFLKKKKIKIPNKLQREHLQQHCSGAFNHIMILIIRWSLTTCEVVLGVKIPIWKLDGLIMHDDLNVENDSWLFTSADEDDAMWQKAAEHMLHTCYEILVVFRHKRPLCWEGFVDCRFEVRDELFTSAVERNSAVLGWLIYWFQSCLTRDVTGYWEK